MHAFRNSVWLQAIELDLQLTPQEYAENLQKTFKNAYKHVSENRDIKMDQAKIYHDRSVRAANFDVNDQVKVLNTAIDPSITKKFKKKWILFKKLWIKNIRRT